MYGYLRLLMIENDISIKQMAKKLGISSANLSKKLSGKTIMALNELIEIRNAFFPEYTLDILVAHNVNVGA